MTYQQALATARKQSAATCGDVALMAMICENSIQILAGAVSPQLVWEGAQKKNLTTRELLELANANPQAIDDLQWL